MTKGGSLAKISCRIAIIFDTLLLYRVKDLVLMIFIWDFSAVFGINTHFFSPARQVGMVYPSFPTNMLPRSDDHVFRWRDKVHRRHVGIFSRYPYRNRKSVRSPAKGHW